MSATSAQPGPVVWLTACGHGDEVCGIVIIQEVFKKIQRQLLRGALHAFPLMNPIGFETASRNITVSGEDLNRSFPGELTGSLGKRIAHHIFYTIMETSPSLVLDLHTDWTKSIPYTLIDSYHQQSNKAIYEKTKSLVRPGDEVKKGQPLAKIVNAFGKHQETVKAINDAIVLGHSDSSVVFPGMPIMAFGMI